MGWRTAGTALFLTVVLVCLSTHGQVVSHSGNSSNGTQASLSEESKLHTSPTALGHNQQDATNGAVRNGSLAEEPSSLKTAVQQNDADASAELLPANVVEESSETRSTADASTRVEEVQAAVRMPSLERSVSSQLSCNTSKYAVSYTPDWSWRLADWWHGVSPVDSVQHLVEDTSSSTQHEPPTPAPAEKQYKQRILPFGEYRRMNEIVQLKEVDSVLGQMRRAKLAHLDDGSRFNYAAADFGAKVVAANAGSKSASAVLSKDRDKYMLNSCSAPEKWVVIELSEEALVDTVALTNYELFSSSVRDFQVLGSRTYPTSEWLLLGEFEAQRATQKRVTQRFEIEEPVAWVRYIQLRLLSHHGEEPYCTLSYVEVFGVDALESFKAEMALMTEEVREVNENAMRSQVVREADKSPASQLDIKNKSAEQPAHSTHSAGEGQPSGEHLSLPLKDVANSQPHEFVSEGITFTVPHGSPSDTTEGAAVPQAQAKPFERGDAQTADGNPLEGSVRLEGLQVDSQLLAEAMDKPLVMDKAPSAGVKDVSNTTEDKAPAAAAKASASSQVGAVSAGPVTADNIFRTLIYKIKSLELNQSLFDRYLEDMNKRYLDTFEEFDVELRTLEGSCQEAKDGVAFLSAKLAALEQKQQQNILSVQTQLKAAVQEQAIVLSAAMDALRLSMLRMLLLAAAGAATLVICVLALTCSQSRVVCYEPKHLTEVLAESTVTGGHNPVFTSSTSCS
eukprot:jgi/Chlat1/1227/Chrsp115S00069